MFASLLARDITLIVIPSSDIDDEYFLPLAHCVAWAAAPEFGQSNDAALAALKQRAEMDLKQMTSDKYTGVTLEGEYF